MTKPKKYEGKLPALPIAEIYLNVDHLEKGKYTLKIIQKNKLITETIFKKD